MSKTVLNLKGQYLCNIVEVFFGKEWCKQAVLIESFLIPRQ